MGVITYALEIEGKLEITIERRKKTGGNATYQRCDRRSAARRPSRLELSLMASNDERGRP
jgi:hypothetical protein